MVMLMGRRGASIGALVSLMARRKNPQAALVQLTAPDRSKLSLVSTALAPGLAFGVLAVVVCAFNYVPQNALIPSLLVGSVASLLSGFCYSELVSQASNAQRETSLYQILYRWMGEGFAFFSAWVSVIFRTCAVALCGRLLASCIDVLSDGVFKQWMSPSGLTGRSQMDIPSALVVIPCAMCIASWNPISRYIVAKDNGRMRSWLCTLLLTTTALALGTYLLGAALLWQSTVQPVTPPGGRYGFSIALSIFGQNQPNGMLTAAALCASMFLAPQFTLQGFPLTPAYARQNPQPKIRPHKDLPYVAAFSTVVTFIFAIGMIAFMCSLKQRDSTIDDPLAFFGQSETSLYQVSWINLSITVFSTSSVIILTFLNMIELGVSLKGLADDGLLPRFFKRHHFGIGVFVASWSALILRAGQLATAMSAGPLVLNAVICFSVIAFRYRKFNERRPAVFSYNLIIGGSSDSDRAPMLEKSASISDGDISSETDSGREDNENTLLKEDEDIDDIVNEYKLKHGVSKESLSILPPKPSKRASKRSSKRADYYILGLVLCFVSLSALLEGISVNFLSHPTTGGSILALTASIVAFCATGLLFALAQQPQTSPRMYRPPKSGKIASIFRVPMCPWLPSLGAFLNVLLFVDVFLSNICPLVCWFITGILAYVLYGAHNSTVTNALPCILQTNGSAPPAGAESTDNIRVTLEPLPIDPWGIVPLPPDRTESPTLKQHRRPTNPFNPVENIVMKR